MHTTNYYNTLIEVADDCKVKFGEVPAQRSEEKTIATLQFEMLRDHPYLLTSDDILFRVHAIKNNINETDHEKNANYFLPKVSLAFVPLR